MKTDLFDVKKTCKKNSSKENISCQTNKLKQTVLNDCDAAKKQNSYNGVIFPAYFS